MRTIRVEAAFIPGEAPRERKPVCILVDAIRASCTVVVLMEKGYRRIFLTGDDEKTIRANRDRIGGDAVICAEKVEGTRAEYADVSPSLRELDAFPDGGGRRVIFRTTNGTLGVRTLRDMGMTDIYIGSMLNLDAVAEATVERAAELGAGVCVVGAGRENGRIYCIDDTYCCAMLIRSILARIEKKGYGADLQDSGKIALGMAKDYASPEDAYEQSATGEIMRRAGTREDILLCARRNISTVVPRAGGVDNCGYLVIEAS